jgi:hypothetical protein
MSANRSKREVQGDEREVEYGVEKSDEQEVEHDVEREIRLLEL